MTIYLAKYSALEALAAAAQTNRGRTALSAARKPRWDALRSADIDRLLRRCPFLSRPVSLVVPDTSQRRNLRDATFHVCKQVRSEGALWNLSTRAPERGNSLESELRRELEPTLGTSSPALCMAQMAAELPPAQLVELACALAGRYKFAPSATGSVIDAKPIATAASMAALLTEKSEIAGSQRARRALDLAIDGLGSPAETALYLLLCLPRKMGGYGLARPVSNSLILPEASRAHLVSQQRFNPDLFWERARLIVEYDSDAHHCAPDQAATDAKRRNELNALGFTVIAVTKDILRQERLFGKLAERLRQQLGARRFPRSETWMRNHAELRRLLLQPSNADRWWR